MGPGELRRFLGLSGGLVELERVVAARRKLRRSVQRLSGKLFSLSCRLETLPSLRGAYFPAGVREHPRNPHGWCSGNRARNLRASASAAALRDRSDTVASQSVSSLRAARRASVPGVRGRACTGLVALFRV